MSKTTLNNIDGWTPIIDDLAKELGLAAAIVFGRVWRFCQMNDNCCWAAQETIAKEYKISSDSVARALKKLVESGYLSEKKESGKTTVYKDTGKAGLSFSVSAFTAPPAKSGDTPRKKREVPTAKCGTKKGFKKEFKDINSESTEFTTIQRLIERAYGVSPITVEDHASMDDFINMGVIEEDVENSKEFFSERNIVVKRFSTIVGPVRYQFLKRTQSKNGAKDRLVGVTNDGELWQRPDGSSYYKIDGKEVEA